MNIEIVNALCTIFIIVGIALLIFASWGYSILPSDCPQNTLRRSLRGLLVSCSIMITICICYMFCVNKCIFEDSKESWDKFLFLMWCLMIINLGFQATIYSEYTSDSNVVCTTNKTFSTYKTLCLPVFVIIVTTILVISLYLLKKAQDSSKERKDEKTRTLEKAQKVTEAKTDRSVMEKEHDDLDILGIEEMESS